MKIVIVGLGIIGASYAKGLNKMYEVYGIDRDSETIKYAVENNFIKAGFTNDYNILTNADLLILAIHPQSILTFIKEYSHLFKEDAIITDVCGVKTAFVYEINKIIKKGIYLSHHPMAGKEKIGIKYADETIFNNANFLITPTDSNCEKGIAILKQIAKDLNFGRISIISPKRHDQMIGFTSQLTHAIAVSLVNSDKDSDTINFIGDSYRDLTRIAMINDGLWSELFLENKTYLLEHIQNFENELERLKKALIEDDKDSLIEIFKQSTAIRRKMNKWKS